MPYNPFQQMIFEMLMQQYPQLFGGMGYGAGAGGGASRNFGWSPYMQPPMQGGYNVPRPPQQGGYNVRRREQPALTHWGQRFLGGQQQEPRKQSPQQRPWERRKRGQQQAPRQWGLGFTGR